MLQYAIDYVTAITDVYRWLDQTCGDEIVFYEKSADAVRIPICMDRYIHTGINKFTGINQVIAIKFQKMSKNCRISAIVRTRTYHRVCSKRSFSGVKKSIERWTEKDIRSEGGVFMISTLMEYTEQLYLIFSNPYIRKLLVEHGYKERVLRQNLSQMV